jgi:hypothetical protein
LRVVIVASLNSILRYIARWINPRDDVAAILREPQAIMVAYAKLSLKK